MRRPIVDEQLPWITITRCEGADLRRPVGGYLSLVDQREPGIFRASDANPISRQRVVNMPPMIVGQRMLRGEIHPIFRFQRLLRPMMQTQAESPMNHPGVVSLRGICPFHSFVRPLEKLGISPQPGFIDPPIAGLIVEGISDVVDLGILEKLPPHFTVDSSALYLRHIAVFQT